METLEIDYYRSHSPFTFLPRHILEAEPSYKSYPELVAIARNLVYHEAYAGIDKLVLPEDAISPPRTADSAVRYAEKIITRLRNRRSGSLASGRPKKDRFIGTCRDYAILLCAFLRSQNRAARLRCGFAFYFEPDKNFGDDHWIVEVWDEEQSRWLIADAEIDKSLHYHAAVTVDPLDVPRNQFQVAGTAWKLLRSGKADPSKYGVGAVGITGEWFMACDVIRDLAALNKCELLPFDYWGIAVEIAESQTVNSDQASVIDSIADVIADDTFDFYAMKRLYEKLDAVRVSNKVVSWPKGIRTEYEFTLQELSLS